MDNINYILRPWQPADLDSLVENANDFDIAIFLTDGFPHPYTREHGEKFIAFANTGESKTFLAIEVGGKAAGGIGVDVKADIMRKNAELGYWLGRKYWGKGIITNAIKEITELAFKKYDITRIYARPYGTNLASQRVWEKAGFKLEFMQ